MSENAVQWFEPDTGEGSGRRYAVRVADLGPGEPPPGARVAAEQAEAATFRDETSLIVSSSGVVGPTEWNYAIDKIGKVLDTLGEPVFHASVRLDRSADPSRERGARARVTVDLRGEPLRARVAATTMTEAIDLLEQRLRDQLHHRSEMRQALRKRGPASTPGQWRHGDATSERPPYFPRPVEEREIVRRKTYAPVDSTVDEAVFDMESMDLDFFLFTDGATGRDAVVWCDGDGYQVRLQGGPGERPEEAFAAPVTLDPEPAAVMSEDQARALLDTTDLPWAFYEDADRGRGRVLYRRYDGHYGEIRPADDET